LYEYLKCSACRVHSTEQKIEDEVADTPAAEEEDELEDEPLPLPHTLTPCES
jgi:hypothetical protein